METMTLGERLRYAVEQNGLSVRAFHREMDDKRGVYGSSYPNIHRYLADKADPSLEFLKQAADLLSVRYQWLAVGQGKPTEAEQADAEADEAFQLENEIRAVLSEEEGTRKGLLGRKLWTDALSEALEDTLGTKVPQVAQVVMAHHWRRLNLQAMESPTLGAPEEMLRRLARSVVAPLKEFEVSVSNLSEDELTHYLMGVVPPISAAMEACLMHQKYVRFQEAALEEWHEEVEPELLQDLFRRLEEGEFDDRLPMPGERTTKEEDSDA